MYDISTKNVKKGKNFFLAFCLFGLLFLIIMGWIEVSSYIDLHRLDSKTWSNKVKINSHVDSDGDTTYYTTYYYRVQGKTYSCLSNSLSSHAKTDNKMIYYDSKNPSDCMVKPSKIFLLFILIPTIFLFFGIINIIKINKRVKNIKKLNQVGKLVKNLPYRMEDTGLAVNHRQIQRPVVDYTLPSGSSIILYGDPRYDFKNCDSDGLIDLVIDENNLDNYFIDFEINRIGGNLITDYHSNNMSKSQESQLSDSQYNFDVSNVNK